MSFSRRNSDESLSKSSEAFGVSRLSRFFVSEVARAQLLGWVVKALRNKRVVQKIDGGHSTFVLEHAWIFQFIDIIYVATIFKLSHLIGLCGRGVDVYVVCIAYFAIMFSTRLSFDVYTCISGASGILHLIAFCFYGMGVFIMTINISSQVSRTASAPHAHASSFGSALTGDVTYGSCERSVDYDTAFAIAFIFTRVVLIVMYGLYFYVFHESNQVGLAPDVAMFANGLRLSDLTNDSDSELVQALHRASMDSRSIASTDHHSRAPSVDHFRPGAERHKSALNGESTGNPMQHVSGDQGNKAAPANPAQPTRGTRTSFVMRVTHKYGEQAVKLHFTRIFVLKVAPVILSSIAMTAMFARVTPVLVLPVVAAIEMVGEFLPSFFIHHAADWRELVPSRHFLEERLGLMFMLVLGEAVLGFSAVSYLFEKTTEIYKVLLFSFFSIFTVGMQYFEPLQSYTRPEGPHPLDVQQLNPVYTWIVFLASFFMLVAANGMVELYGHVAGDDVPGIYDGDLSYQKQKVAMGLGTVTLLIIVLKIFDKVYYRERLLPKRVFLWLDSFYQRAEQERHQPAPSYALNPVASRSRSQSAASGARDGDHNKEHNHADDSPSEGSDSGSNRTASGDHDPDDALAHSSTVNKLVSAVSGHDRASLRASTIGSVRGGTVLGFRETLPVVEKKDLVMGIRRIRPLTVLRIAIAITQFLLWEVKGIPLEDYMVYYAVLLVFPSVVEMGLEIRYVFVRPYQDEESGGSAAHDGHNLRGKHDSK